MKITKKIYDKAKIAVGYGFKFLVKSKNKKPFYNDEAKGKNFSKVKLQDIVSLYENGIFHIDEKYLESDEVISICVSWREGVNFKTFMKMEKLRVLPLKRKTIVPSIFYHTENLTEALKKNCWYKYKIDDRYEYIYVDWYNTISHYPGTFKYIPDENYYIYQHNDHMIKMHKLNDLLDLIK